MKINAKPDDLSDYLIHSKSRRRTIFSTVFDDARDKFLTNYQL